MELYPGAVCSLRLAGSRNDRAHLSGKKNDLYKALDGNVVVVIHGTCCYLSTWEAEVVGS